MGPTTRPATAARRAPKADPHCVDAVDLARAALVAASSADQVGEHLGYVAEADRVVTHFFGCRLPGYVGWRWAVTVTRASRARVVTVDESVLLPGEEALLAPEWLPWEERLRPEDLAPGSLLPAAPDDPRLLPGYTGADADLADDEAVRSVVDELGLGRERVLSVEGRELAAQRWYDGEGGPRSPLAIAAPAQCKTCGFLLRLSGPLGAAFGVCANEMSPSDGGVVSYDHGCGAHSSVPTPPGGGALPEPVLDTLAHEELGHS